MSQKRTVILVPRPIDRNSRMWRIAWNIVYERGFGSAELERPDLVERVARALIIAAATGEPTVEL